MKVINYLFAFCSILVLMGAGCIFKEKCGSGGGTYKFYVPFSIYPTSDTIKLNDTLWLHANFSNQFLDSSTLNYYKVENHPLMNFIYMIRIDTLPIIDGFKDFTVLPDTGSVFNSLDPDQALRYILYLYQNDRYQFSAKVLPHKTGVYLLGFGAIPRQEVDFQEYCFEEYMNIFFTTNNNTTDNNYYLLTLCPDTAYQKIPVEAFLKVGSFCFRVVE
ncbi:MAG TPA: hypothetical protein PK239_12335 [Chitinophagales bacterium]|nr:hypothetical protein [Chitinophagales bacterium]